MPGMPAAAPNEPFFTPSISARPLGRADQQLPSLKTVQAALRKTTETLARELAHPGAQPPPWSEFEWRIARAAASLHGVSPLLATRLRWHGPPGWESFLEEQKGHTRLRHLRLRGLLIELDQRACELGAAFVALKGAALHEMGLYQAGDRPMADLDLLADAANARQLAQILADMQFRQTAVTWKHYLFEPLQISLAGSFGEQANNALKIDLHVRIREILPRRAVDVAHLLLSGSQRPGSNPYPSAAALMIHLLLHAAGAIVSRSLRLIQLHDVALLCARMSERDWQAVLDLGKSVGGLWWALSPLTLVARYYDTIPVSVLSAVEADCMAPLRRSCSKQLLSDVSYSDLRRSAFPGIEWTQSPAECLAYAAERTWLSVSTLLRTVSTGRSSLKAGNSSLHEPRSRALHFMALRPARPATLKAVRAALAQQP
jgi:hypothetical protein